MTTINAFVRVSILLLLCIFMTPMGFAQTFTTVASFDGSNGANPSDTSLVQALDGNFYGTTFSGGPHGAGTLFRVTPTGTLSGIYGFCGDCTAGYFAEGPLLLSSTGSIYGTTENGGPIGAGMAYKMSPGGAVSTLYSFCSEPNCDDGSQPASGLIQASNGNFYGTAPEGGVNGNATGTIFEISPDGTFTLLYSFCSLPNCSDGLSPLGLAQGSDGNFYGITQRGGANSAGTIYRITPEGKFTLIHTFCNTVHCIGVPTSQLLLGTDGNFYGETSTGVYKLASNGAFTPLYDFCAKSGCPDGEQLLGGLIQASDGNFYGTALYGGAYADGTVFQITSAGVVTVLYDFCALSGCADGEQPAGITQGTNGNLYGATVSGGNGGSACVSSKCGTIYSISLGLAPFVKALPPYGQVARTIYILGQGLTGTTAVSFNGVPAAFSVLSDTHLKATVPSGATTGIVTVTTPAGPLSTIGSFQVKP